MKRDNINYDKTEWVDNVTVVNAERMNKIEKQLESLTTGYNWFQGTNQSVAEVQREVEKVKTKADLIKTDQPIDTFLSGNGTYKELTIKKNNLPATQGTITLQTNKFYRGNLSNNVTFTLPTITDDSVLNQILIQANVTANINITWGTDLYFNEPITNLTTGKYNIVFEYNGNNWVYGVITIAN